MLGDVPVGAASNSPYHVTLTATDGHWSQEVAFDWFVAVPNVNTVSLPKPGGGGNIEISSPVGTSLDAAITQDPGVALPNGITFPFGFLELAFTVPSAGTAATVTISGLDTNVITDYYKYGVTPDDSTDPHWYSFLNDAQTGTGMEIVDGNLVLHFVDGGRGDDDLQPNGVIFDIGGPVGAGQVDSPPTATNLSAAETYTEDTPLNLTDIVVSDVDSPAVTATLTLSDPAAGSLNTTTSGAVTSTYNAGTGVWSASGAIADVNVLLAGLTFTPALNFNGSFTTATSVSDGVAAAITGSKAMTGVAVNDAPVASGSASLAAVAEDTAQPPGDTVSDLFGGNFSDAADQVSGGSTADTLYGVAITANAATAAQGTWQYSADGATWTAVGSPTAAGALVLTATGRLRFVPAANFNGAPGGLTATLIESGGATPASGATVNLSGLGATGGTTIYSAASVALSTSITAVNGNRLTLANDAGLTVNELAKATITSALLAVTDSNNAVLASGLVYTLAAAPRYGKLQLGGKTLKVGSTFTQAGIDAGKLAYTESGSANLTDGFSFTVSDGTPNGTTSGSFAITVADPVKLAANKGLTLNEKATATITGSMLKATDKSGNVQYVVAGLPVSGNLLLGGIALELNDTFTQADINAKHLSYQNRVEPGSATDSFSFSVSDGSKPGGIASATFVIHVNGSAVIAVGSKTLNAQRRSRASLQTATFTDPAGADPGNYTATINWGDHSHPSTTTGLISGTSPFTVSGSHTFAKTGRFIIVTTITHGGTTSTAKSTVTVSSAIAGVVPASPLFLNALASGTAGDTALDATAGQTSTSKTLYQQTVDRLMGGLGDGRLQSFRD